MNLRNQRIKKLKDELDLVFKEIPQSKDVEMRYRTIRRTLMAIYPKTIETINKDTFLELLKDACYLDRILRLKTKGNQVEKKKELEYTVGRELCK